MLSKHVPGMNCSIAFESLIALGRLNEVSAAVAAAAG
jgi:hypothetical protein